MASAMATAASRNIPPPYTIPVGPRIRPPRLLPGTKAANTNPQPNGPPPTPGNVWVQGQWRNPGSNAARDRREVQSKLAEKALRHATHGMNIYAYSHMRTNQVVYSLTRVMQNTKILPQLLNHGKQTVPANLRRDLWRPYFSIHFPETAAGAQAGLKAYLRLRELSVQRQLSPPSELITATEADVLKAKAKYAPIDLKAKLDAKRDDPKVELDIPIQGRLLPKKLRAKRLMDQKATSVADAAYVLGFVNQELSPAEQLKSINEARERRQQKLSKRAARRLDTIREKEAVKGAQIEARQEIVHSQEGRLGMTPHAAKKMALEFGGVVTAPWKGTEYTVSDPKAITIKKAAADESASTLSAGGQRPTEFDQDKYRIAYISSWQQQNAGATEGPAEEDIQVAIEQERERVESQIADYNRRAEETKSLSTEGQETGDDTSKTVRVLWADLRDATWAEQWSSNVYHGELEGQAAIQHERVLSQQKRTIDEEGNEIPGQLKKVVVQTSTTPHVFGQSTDARSYQTPEKMDEQRQKQRAVELDEWRSSRLEQSKKVLADMDALQQQREVLMSKRLSALPEYEMLQQWEARHESQSIPEVALTPAEEAIQNLTDAEKIELKKSMVLTDLNLAANATEILEMERNYPSLYQVFTELLAWREEQKTYTTLLNLKDEVEGLYPGFESEDSATSQRLQEIDLTLGALADKYDNLATIASLESDLALRVAKYHEDISNLEAAQSGSSDEKFLSDIENTLRNKRNLLLADRAEAWGQRTDAIQNTIEHIEAENDQLVDLLRQRRHAEQSGNSEQLETLDAELQAKEDDKVLDLLGHEMPKPVEAKITEYDESMRERGVEAPPPPKKGVWGRVKGLFGR